MYRHASILQMCSNLRTNSRFGRLHRYLNSNHRKPCPPSYQQNKDSLLFYSFLQWIFSPIPYYCPLSIYFFWSISLRLFFGFPSPILKKHYLWSFLNESSPVNFIKRLIYRVDFLRISSLLIFLLVHSSGNFSLRILNISLITRTRLRSLAFLRDIMQKSKCANRQSYYDIDT